MPDVQPGLDLADRGRIDGRLIPLGARASQMLASRDEVEGRTVEVRAIDAHVLTRQL